jgi:hypothetical protein
MYKCIDNEKGTYHCYIVLISFHIHINFDFNLFTFFQHFAIHGFHYFITTRALTDTY